MKRDNRAAWPTAACAYLYNQGTWEFKDSDVYDISGADSGYFYDVNYADGNYYGYQWNPYGGWGYGIWTYLDSGLS
jgi:hypothetical protein